MMAVVLGVAVAIGVALAVWVVRALSAVPARRAGRGGASGVSFAGRTGTEPFAVSPQVLELAQGGRRQEAVDLLVRTLGVGAAQAEGIVDAMAGLTPQNVPGIPGLQVASRTIPLSFAVSLKTEDGRTHSMPTDVIELARAGRMAEAAARLSAHTGMAGAGARQVVEALSKTAG